MGFMMREDDIYISTLFDLFNLRFGPAQAFEQAAPLYGGIAEMAALQQEFQIFREGRLFAETAALLGLGGLTNNQAKNRWLALLRDLVTYGSNVEGLNGDQAIVRSLIRNFEKKPPSPCYMRPHDSREDGRRLVFVYEDDLPIHYMESRFLTLSLPMKPRTEGRP
jgi:hypothetical protein